MKPPRREMRRRLLRQRSKTLLVDATAAYDAAFTVQTMDDLVTTPEECL
jgi:hypothetical protein